MDDLLGTTLCQLADIGDEERRLLRSCLGGRRRDLPARRTLVAQEDAPGAAILIVEGWAARQKMLVDGRQQIVQLLLPGDLFCPNIVMREAGGYALQALTPISYVELGRERIRYALELVPKLANAFMGLIVRELAIQREWLVNLGARSAQERIAHLFCELHHRLRLAGRARGNSFEMPLTQVDLAEVAGLTSVHVNRTLQGLRALHLIRTVGREVILTDRRGLEVMSLFDPGYLIASALGKAGPFGKSMRKAA